LLNTGAGDALFTGCLRDQRAGVVAQATWLVADRVLPIEVAVRIPSRIPSSDPDHPFPFGWVRVCESNGERVDLLGFRLGVCPLNHRVNVVRA
jgi:hypothetical protein